ncbi:MAG: FxsB family cyclophane-forming radical SAM/SPASM peptide maturase [Actinoplanes sp.]
MTAAAVRTARDAQRRAAPWPYAGLTTDHPARPVQQVVLKVHQRCNLACDYCYVYEMADQSWRTRPQVMPADVWQATLAELSRHAERNALTRLSVVLHGGEPLLLGAARLDALATELRAAVPAGCDLEIGLQTNGVLLNEAKIELFRRHRIKIGVSVDGLPADHDRHRVRANGRGTSGAVARALTLLSRPENREVYAGVLCTVSPRTDPVATLAYLSSFAPPLIDLLLPHANWATPPDGPFADWLIAAFDAWYAADAPPRVRLFDDLLALLLGGAGRSEQLGLSPVALAVVETDGTIELVDSLKSAYPGASATGLDIRHDQLDDLRTDPGYVARQIGADALSDECRRCPVRDVCGGGHYVHRYRPGQGFRNPSVYCADLRRLIEHAHGRVTADLVGAGT